MRRRLDWERPVPRDVIERCIDVAAQAPTGMNAEAWRFLVLDEATTALDPESETEVWNSLKELRDQVTVLAVSHQNALTDAADRIYRVEGGKVVRVEPAASGA